MEYFFLIANKCGTPPDYTSIRDDRPEIASGFLAQESGRVRIPLAEFLLKIWKVVGKLQVERRVREAKLGLFLSKKISR